MNKKVFLRTFGCQMNFRDAEIVLGMLENAGYERTDEAKEAELLVFVTCSVRQHAEDRVIGQLQRLVSWKKEKPDLRIAVVGCMAERHGEMLLKEYPHVDLVAGPNSLYDIPAVLPRIMAGEKLVLIKSPKRPKNPAESVHFAGILRPEPAAFVNIMYGCDNYCSYCVVPYVRGREVSRPKSDILKEIKGLVKSGCVEVALLGQNVNSYGRGLSEKIDFPELLEEVNGIEGLRRIRFVTSHPKDADKKLFRSMAELDKVCAHLHLPLQSGSDKILDLMNRKYTIGEYIGKVNDYRALVPGGTITTDIIVGFPSEKEADYEATKKAIQEIRFNSAFIFKYSPRSPAMSATLVDDVPEEVKKDRNNELLEMQKTISLERNNELIGSQQEVLVENQSRMSPDEMMGKTRGNITCVFPGSEEIAGKIVRVRIIGASPGTLKGERIDG